MSDRIEELAARVEALDRQLCRMEERVGSLEEHDARLFGPQVAANLAPAGSAGAVGPAQKASENALALTGRTLVALAGGYLIRALTDAGLLPGLGVVALGLAYALLWTLLAERAAARGARSSASFHGIAGALIAYPLLWETTTRFGLLQPPRTLAILVLVCAASLIVAARWNLGSLAWVGTLMALGTTAGVFASTHYLLPAVAVLLVVAAGIEVLAFRDLWPGLRWPAALVLDACLLLMVILASDPAGLPRDYPALSLGLAVAAVLAAPAIYLAGTVARTLLRGIPVTLFEVCQSSTALVLGFGGAWKLTGSRGAVAAGLGAASLLLGALCYAVAFAFIERRTGRCRNFYFYSTTGGVLALVGSAAALTGPALTMLWSALAVAFAWLGSHFQRLTLRYHTVFYLAGGVLNAGLLAAAAQHLFGSHPDGWPMPAPAGWCAAAAAAACYAVFVLDAHSGDRAFHERLPREAAAWTTVWILAGILVAVVARGLAGLAVAGPPSIATMRTAVLAFLILGLAWARRRFGFRELGWLVYAFLAVGAFKLVTEDLRLGHSASLFLSLIFYGGALTAAPRLVRWGD